MIENIRQDGLRGLWRGQGGKITLSLMLCAAMIGVLLARLANVEPAEVAQAFRALPVAAWTLAALTSGISFWAVGQYDVVIHRHLATGIPPSRAGLAGICAIAVSQMMGLGLITGAVLRWRMLPEIGLWAATRLTAAVALSFLAAWAIVTCATLTALPAAPFRTPALCGLALGGMLCLVAAAAPRRGWPHLRWPNLFTQTRLLALCLVDTFAAALALYALCPAALSFIALLPAFLLALGAGLISGTPGGLGSFEVAFLAFLPTSPDPQLLAALLGWRLVYFALPAIVGAGLAIRGSRELPFGKSPDLIVPLPNELPPATMILRQGEHAVIGDAPAQQWVAARSPHCLIGLFEPLAPSPHAGNALLALRQKAHTESRIAVIYGAGPRLAAQARRAGFRVVVAAREAMITPAAYDIDTASRAGLRRKLRRAVTAGVEIEGPMPPDDLTAADWRALDQIAAQWAVAHGGERGFSMGRYAREYLRGQRLYIARIGGRPVAFVTFHQGSSLWLLDLMRHLPQIPDGTMQALIHRAILDAKAHQIAQVSLAAAPEPAFADARGPARMLARCGMTAGKGLHQFKCAFAPDWQSRYLCVPNASLLPLAALEIARAIHRPAALPGETADNSQMHLIEQHPAEYAFASVKGAWQDGENFP